MFCSRTQTWQCPDFTLISGLNSVHLFCCSSDVFPLVVQWYQVLLVHFKKSSDQNCESAFKFVPTKTIVAAIVPNPCVRVCVQCSVFYFCSMVGCQMRESFHLKWLVPSCSSTHQFLLDVCNHQPTSTIIFKIYVLQISIVTSMIHSFNSWNSLFWLVEFRTNPFLIPFQSRQRDALFLWVAVH